MKACVVDEGSLHVNAHLDILRMAVVVVRNYMACLRFCKVQNVVAGYCDLEKKRNLIYSYFDLF